MQAPHIQIAGALSSEEIKSIDQSFKLAHKKGLHCAIGLVYGDSDHLNEAVLQNSTIKTCSAELQYGKLVLITYFSKHQEIVAAVEATGISALQLHGPIEASEIQLARKEIPDLFLIKSLPIAIDIPEEQSTTEALKELKAYEDDVDCFITDTKTTVAGELRFGATGVTHPWSISAAIVKSSKIPVIIAGGLNPENVSEAIKATKPYGVDVHSGVEDPQSSDTPALRLKCKLRLEAFIKNTSNSLS